MLSMTQLQAERRDSAAACAEMGDTSTAMARLDMEKRCVEHALRREVSMDNRVSGIADIWPIDNGGIPYRNRMAARSQIVGRLG